MTVECSFEFDRVHPVFYSGETITGRVILRTTEPISLSSIQILLDGGAKVRWSEEQMSRVENGLMLQFEECFSGDESYINSMNKVFDGGLLPAGTHTYSFNKTLPSECGSTCNELYGQIDYVMSLILAQQPPLSAKVLTQPLILFHALDLNLNHDYLYPLKTKKTKSFFYSASSSGIVKIKLSIPCGGYAPGQTISYSLKLNNWTLCVDIEDIKLQLVQIYKFTAQTPPLQHKQHKNILSCSERSEKCYRRSNCQIEGTLKIPAVLPPTCDDKTDSSSRIINLRYQLELAAKTSDGRMDISEEITLTLVIGSVPLINNAGFLCVREPPASTTDTENSPMLEDLRTMCIMTMMSSSDKTKVVD